jgi:hypothetical protein
MELKQLSKEKETEVVAAIKEAIALTNGGMEPSSAITKIASQHKFTGELAQRMVEVFNNSKTLAMFKDAEFDRTAEFEVADPNKVVTEMFPEHVKTSADNLIARQIPDAYSTVEQNFNKKASHLPKTELSEHDYSLGMLIQHGFAGQAKDAQAIKAAEFDAYLLNDSIMRNVSALTTFFKTAYHRPFAEVETDVVSVYGELGKQAMDLVWKLARMEDRTYRTEKRASADPEKSHVVDEKLMPFPIVTELVSKLTKLGVAQEGIEHMKAASKDFWSKFENKLSMLKQSMAGEEARPDPFDLMMKAAAAPFPPTEPPKPKKGAKGARGAAGKPGPAGPPGAPSQAPTYTPSTVYTSPEIVNMLDPDFDTQMKSIQMSTMITDLMSNDEELSQADPEKVISLYNDIAKLAPTLATEPLAMRGLLRYYIKGGDMDRFELNNIVDLEKKLKESRKFQPEVQIA